MNIVWELNPVSLIAVLTNIIWTTVFLVRASDRSLRAEGKADKALDLIQELKERQIQLSAAEGAANKAAECAHECKEKITILNGSFAAYRESVAQNYVSRADMRDFEDRMEKSIDKLGTRMEHAVEHRRPPHAI